MDKRSDTSRSDGQFALVFKEVVFPLLSERLNTMQDAINSRVEDIKADIKDLNSSMQDIKNDFTDLKISHKTDHDIIHGPSGLSAKYEVMWSEVTELQYIKRHAWAIITIGATMLATAIGWGVSVYTSDKYQSRYSYNAVENQDNTYHTPKNLHTDNK